MSDVDQLGSALAPLYQIHRHLGQALVGTAFDGSTGDGEACRIMVLPRDIREAMTEPGRFTRELERAGRFSHPGVLRSVGAGVPASDIGYFAFERPSGPSSRDTLSRARTLPAHEVASIGAALASTLASLHAEGLLHGLIVPELVFLPEKTAASEVRLAGAGIFHGMVAAGVPATILAERMGLEHYLSPEQLAGTALDARTDVYLLGVTLYELLTGRPPFGGRTTSTVMVSVLADEPTKTAPGGIRAPGKTVSAILRAIEKDPSDRWPSIGAFGAALLEREHGEGQKSATKRTARRRGCLPLLLVGAGVCLVLVFR